MSWSSVTIACSLYSRIRILLYIFSRLWISLSQKNSWKQFNPNKIITRKCIRWKRLYFDTMAQLQLRSGTHHHLPTKINAPRWAANETHSWWLKSHCFCIVIWMVRKRKRREFSLISHYAWSSFRKISPLLTRLPGIFRKTIK